LTALASHLVGPHRSTILREAWAAAQVIGDGRERVRALARLLGHMPPHRQGEVERPAESCNDLHRRHQGSEASTRDGDGIRPSPDTVAPRPVAGYCPGFPGTSVKGKGTCPSGALGASTYEDRIARRGNRSGSGSRNHLAGRHARSIPRARGAAR
jgi:hypothetical protein